MCLNVNKIICQHRKISALQQKQNVAIRFSRTAQYILSIQRIIYMHVQCAQYAVGRAYWPWLAIALCICIL